MTDQNYIVSFADIAIRECDIETLSKPCNWVNDAIIHIFGRILEIEANKTNPNKILFVGPCTIQFIRFFQCDEEVQSCLENMKINSFESVFFPITNGTSLTSRGDHWSLLIFIPSSKTFLYCDSVGRNGNIPMAQSLIQRLELLLNFKKSDLVIVDLPTQNNSYDCGVFIMAYMDYYSKFGGFNGIENNVSQNKMNELRKKFTSRILNLSKNDQS